MNSRFLAELISTKRSRADTSRNSARINLDLVKGEETKRIERRLTKLEGNVPNKCKQAAIALLDRYSPLPRKKTKIAVKNTPEAPRMMAIHIPTKMSLKKQASDENCFTKGEETRRTS